MLDIESPTQCTASHIIEYNFYNHTCELPTVRVFGLDASWLLVTRGGEGVLPSVLSSMSGGGGVITMAGSSSRSSWMGRLSFLSSTPNMA